MNDFSEIPENKYLFGLLSFWGIPSSVCHKCANLEPSVWVIHSLFGPPSICISRAHLWHSWYVLDSLRPAMMLGHPSPKWGWMSLTESSFKGITHFLIQISSDTLWAHHQSVADPMEKSRRTELVLQTEGTPFLSPLPAYQKCLDPPAAAISYVHCPIFQKWVKDMATMQNVSALVQSSSLEL